MFIINIEFLDILVLSSIDLFGIDIKHPDSVLNLTISILIPMAIIFFGVSQGNNSKSFKLKNILILYFGTIIIFLFLNNVLILGLLIILTFMSGGFILLNTQENLLENELNGLQLFWYNSCAWIFLNKNYIWFLSILLIIFIKIFIKDINEFTKEYIDFSILFLISIFLITQYVAVAKDFFGIKSFEEVQGDLKINTGKSTKPASFEEVQGDLKINTGKSTKPASFEEVQGDLKINIGKNIKQESLYDGINYKLLAFIVFMEDRNLFERKTYHVTIFTDFFKNSEYKKMLIEAFGESHNNKKFNVKSYIRGYSTIEKQVIRSTALRENSYRYTARRKLFLECKYLKYFIKTVCKRKARSLTRNKKVRKEYRDDLTMNLKYHFLLYYYKEILNNPNNTEELINSMSKESSLDKEDYQSILEKFRESKLEKYHLEQLEVYAQKNNEFH